jgi:phosphoglycolate phosphatase-like HAD superfamily hydrolase
VYAVLFDIDGTLVTTGGAGQLAFAKTFHAEFGVPQLCGTVKFAGRSDRAIAQELMGVHGVEISEDNWRRFRTTYLRMLPEALHERRGAVLPGVVALLDSLAAMQRPLIGLLTGNLRGGATTKLTHYGLHGRFSFGGFGDHTESRCEIASMALEEARQFAANRHGGATDISGVMVIGDTEHDVTCARSIGAVAVAVPTGNTPRSVLEAAEPDVLLDSLSDARRLLDLVSDANGGL